MSAYPLMPSFKNFSNGAVSIGVRRLAVVVALLASAQPLAAQIVGGQVVDSAGHPLSNVALRLVDSTRTAVDSTTADSLGTFYLTAKRAGTYVVQLDASGLIPIASQPIRVAGDAFEQRRIVMRVVPNVPIYSAADVDRPVRSYSSNRPPAYPEASQFKEREGKVVLQFIVDSTGHVMPGTIRATTSPDSLLTSVAIRALTTFRFYPAEVKHRPVATMVIAPFEFQLLRQPCWPGPDSLTAKLPTEYCKGAPQGKP